MTSNTEKSGPGPQFSPEWQQLAFVPAGAVQQQKCYGIGRGLGGRHEDVHETQIPGPERARAVLIRSRFVEGTCDAVFRFSCRACRR